MCVTRISQKTYQSENNAGLLESKQKQHILQPRLHVEQYGLVL
jgi:hypothetical protein